MSNPSATASLRIKTTPEQIDALAEAFQRLLVASGGMVKTARALAKDKAKLAKAEDDVTSATKLAAGALAKESREGDKASASMKRMAQATDALKTRLTAAVGTLFAMEMAKKAVNTVSRTLTSSINAFAATNEDAKAQVDGLKEASTALGAALGEALIGGERGAQVFGALDGILAAFETTIRENADAVGGLAQNAIGGLLSALPYVVDGIVAVVNTANVAKLAWIGLRAATLTVTEALAQLSSLIARGLLTVISGAADAVGALQEQLGRLAGAVGLARVSLALRDAGQGTRDFADRVTQADAAVAEFASNSRRSYGEAMTEYGQAASSVADDMVNLTLRADELKARLGEVREGFAAGTLAAREFASAPERAGGGGGNAREEEGRLIERNRNLLAGYQEAVAAARREEEERLAFIDAANVKTDVAMKNQAGNMDASIDRIRAAKAEWQSLGSTIAGTATQSVVGFAQSVSAAMGEAIATNASFGEALAKTSLTALGALATQIGAIMIAVGAGASALPMIFGFGGPAAIAAGAVLTAIGAGLSAVSSKIGAGGSGGGTSSAGGRVSAPASTGTLPAATTNSETYVSTTNVNFGWVSDPEAAGAVMSGVDRRNQRLGYR